MFNQLQFEGMPQPSAASSAPREPQAPEPSPQHEKQAQNRRRITAEGNARSPYGGGETVPVERYGLEMGDVDEHDIEQFRRMPHDTFNFRRHARTEFVNLTGPGQLKTFQETVNPHRVKQLAEDPSMGSDPRFPGRELPKVIRTRDDRTMVINGTHRIAAARGYQGQLFTEARVLHESDIKPRPAWVRRAAGERDSLAYKRYRENNAEAKP